MGLIVAFPVFEFSIGPYELNAFTYPAWTSLLVQFPSIILNCLFIKRIETPDTPNTANQTQKKPKKKFYFSIGILLGLSLFFFNGYFLFAIIYALPIVMLDGYGW